jgi:transposase
LHRRKHVAAARQAVFHAHHRAMDQLHHGPHHEPSPQENDTVPVPTERSVPMTKAQPQIAHNRAKRVADSAQAQALCQQGGTIKAIAAHLGRHPRTVQQYLGASPFPDRPPRRHPRSLLAPYKTAVVERWTAGCHSVKALLHEMHARGLPGKYSVVAHDVSRLRPPEGRRTRRRKGGAAATPREVEKPLPPRRATWLVMRRVAQLDEDAKTQRARLQAQEGASAEAITLTQDLAGLVRQRQPAQLEAW